MRWYVINLLCAIDQLLNAVCGGWCDETMSAHFYRLHRDGKPWGWLMRPVDLLFAWQTLHPGAIGHCHSAWLKELERYQMPPEARP